MDMSYDDEGQEKALFKYKIDIVYLFLHLYVIPSHSKRYSH